MFSSQKHSPQVQHLQWRRVLSAEVVRAACWSPLQMCAQCESAISATRLVPIVHVPVWAVQNPTHAEDFYARLHWDGWLPQSTSTHSHRPIIPLPSRPHGNRMGNVQIRVYPRVGSGRSITEPTLMPVACRAIHYANCGLNEWTDQMLIKNFVDVQLPSPFFSLPPSLLIFLLHFHIFSHSQVKNLRQHLGSLAGSGGARQKTFSEFWAERVLWGRQF